MATRTVWPDVAIPPGETLAEELQARGLSQSELARRMNRPVQAINEIVRGMKLITPETALRLELPVQQGSSRAGPGIKAAPRPG